MVGKVQWPVCSAPLQHLPATQISCPWPCICEPGAGQLTANRTDRSPLTRSEQGTTDPGTAPPRARGKLGLQPPRLLTGTASRKERQQKTTRAKKSGHTSPPPCGAPRPVPPLWQTHQPHSCLQEVQQGILPLTSVQTNSAHHQNNLLSSTEEQSYFSTGWCVVPEAEQESLIPAQPWSSAQTTPAHNCPGGAGSGQCKHCS